MPSGHDFWYTVCYTPAFSTVKEVEELDKLTLSECYHRLMSEEDVSEGDRVRLESLPYSAFGYEDTTTDEERAKLSVGSSYNVEGVEGSSIIIEGVKVPIHCIEVRNRRPRKVNIEGMDYELSYNDVARILHSVRFATTNNERTYLYSRLATEHDYEPGSIIEITRSCDDYFMGSQAYGLNKRNYSKGVCILQDIKPNGSWIIHRNDRCVAEIPCTVCRVRKQEAIVLGGEEFKKYVY